MSHARQGEDLICQGIFEVIGEQSRVAVEFGAASGVRLSNVHLFRSEGWTVHQWDREPLADVVKKITVESHTVNDIFRDEGVPLEFDLLSIDVDGCDYWIFKSLKHKPRVVILEWNPFFAEGQKYSVPDMKGFRWSGNAYFGASFTAMKELGHRKGYKLAATTRDNLIMVREAEWRGHPEPKQPQVKSRHRPVPLSRFERLGD